MMCVLFINERSRQQTIEKFITLKKRFRNLSERRRYSQPWASYNGSNKVTVATIRKFYLVHQYLKIDYDVNIEYESIKETTCSKESKVARNSIASSTSMTFKHLLQPPLLQPIPRQLLPDTQYPLPCQKISFDANTYCT